MGYSLSKILDGVAFDQILWKLRFNAIKCKKAMRGKCWSNVWTTFWQWTSPRYIRIWSHILQQIYSIASVYINASLFSSIRVRIKILLPKFEYLKSFLPNSIFHHIPSFHYNWQIEQHALLISMYTIIKSYSTKNNNIKKCKIKKNYKIKLSSNKFESKIGFKLILCGIVFLKRVENTDTPYSNDVVFCSTHWIEIVSGLK